MKAIIDGIWQFMNMGINFGDITFKYVYFFYLSISLTLLNMYLSRRK